jgi:hypothetical protein
MSKLRSECRTSAAPAISDNMALRLIRDAVFRRRVLIHGQLDDDKGRHCAMGAFWADHPDVTVNTALVDEVAAVNDAVPPTATLRERWKIVHNWLRLKTGT